MFPKCWKPLFRTFLIGDFVPQRESKESMQSGNRCKTEREEREGSGINVAELVDVNEKVDGTVLGVILFRLTESSILMIEISEDTWNEELNKPFLVNIQLRENYTRLSTTWRFRT